MNPSDQSSAAIHRHLGLDWLRIAAFGLLILVHIGMYFSPRGWVVSSVDSVEWVAWIMPASDPWRLSLLFLVSGFASRALLQKLGSAGSFARSRTIRLALPLLFGTAVVVAPQGWVKLTEVGYTDSFWHFWINDWFRFSELREVELPNTEHLWFVTYLWVYSLLLAVVVAWLSARSKLRLSRLIKTLVTGYRVLAVPIILIVTLRLSILFVIPETGTVFTNWHGHVTYVPPFLFGFALAGAPSLWPAILRSWRFAAAISAGSYLILLWAEINYPSTLPPSHLEQVVFRSASGAMGWAMSLLLLAAAHQWLQRDHPLRRLLSQAVFPFYIIHQTIIVVVGWELRQFGLGAPAEFVILLGSTCAGCWAFFELGSRVPWLRPLVGLTRTGRTDEHRPVTLRDKAV